MLRLTLLVLLLKQAPPWTTTPPRWPAVTPTGWPSGTLTLLVRLADGTPVAGLRVELWQDTDTDGLLLRRTGATDQTGALVLPGLPWAVYRVQLVGTLPDGRTVSMAALPTDDGAALDGFGVRFAMDQHTELYVLTPTDAGLEATFDMAPDASGVPDPYVPALAPSHDPGAPSDPPTPPPASGAPTAVPPPARGRWDVGCLAVVGLLSLAAAALLGRGWWLGRTRRRTRKGRPHV